MHLKQIYRLKDDERKIKAIQDASLDKGSYAGYKIEKGLVFGSVEWFNAIENEIIPKHFIKGTISRVYMSGHNDYPEFEILSNGLKSIWGIAGGVQEYEVGNNIELVYVEQKFKRYGAISKCIIEIKIAK